nr:glycine zipper 2TM domain-containing protein [Desulfobulbaceae bacterium]
MKPINILLYVCVFTLLTTSCVTNKAQTGTAGGAAGGAIVGQAIGRDTESTLIGAAVGALLGYMVGNEMDKNDRAMMNQAYESSPSFKTTQWVNPDTGNTYSVTPKPAYQQPKTGSNCREAEILTTIGGKAEKAVTTACRIDGRWVIQ